MKRHRRIYATSTLFVLTLLMQFAAAQTPAGQERWLATWCAAMQQPGNTAISNQTVCMFVRTGVGGRRARLQLSNTFGKEPVVLGPVHIALHGKGSAIVPGSDRALTFSGNPTVVVRDPANPKQLNPPFNNGDHLHPNDAGYKAMAESINLAVFSKR
jgi:hypothetical protein